MKIELDDAFFMLLRSSLAIALFYYLGLSLGFLACAILNYINNLVMWYAFGLEALYHIDELFINDDTANPSNIVSKHTSDFKFPLSIGALVTQRYDFDKIRD
jgi:hypothetical protein